MSVAPASGAAEQPAPPTSSAPREKCPLCAAPLHPEQEWCLNCGAAARTRLAASPAWKAPIVSIVVVLVLSLGVLAGSLVKLAGGSTPAATQTTTVTAPATTTQPQLPSTTATTATTTPTTSVTPTTPATTAPSSLAPGRTQRALEGDLKIIKSPGLKKAIEERLRKLGQLPPTGK